MWHKFIRLQTTMHTVPLQDLLLLVLFRFKFLADALSFFARVGACRIFFTHSRYDIKNVRYLLTLIKDILEEQL